ncbi:hypothetical protein [Nitrosospira sp. Nsp13]|uniref:hypothetical protein n=1 Tax=Nitrosospira sp. Nsp13 TaxID=1855332 RepID=UPI000885124F|nr:hypothetical protein [Nitrosospira sp. Nsp13]SCY38047.1 Glutathione synthase/RimK-type ligase, ATP-grasp superfamily [Nitrosospira sp. Nsp13]
MINAMESVRWPLDHERILPLANLDMARVFTSGRNGLAFDSGILQEAGIPTTKNVADAWARLSDSDLWGLLGQEIEAHPEWSDVQCREILQAWVELRRSSPWQAELLKYWQRWKQHHLELKKGLAQAGHLTWAQKCRYCELWSANRPIMSPFCGVAEILLGVSELEIKAPPMESGASSRYQQNPGYFGERKGSQAEKKARKSEVIVVSADSTLEKFSEFGASRQLVWALENCGLSWSLCQPWDDSIELDPHIVRGVVFWSYRHRSHDFVYHAMAFEKACKARRIPVINSVFSGWDVRHSTILGNLRQAGIRCPKFQKFASVDDIELPYPLILRVDGIHRGQQMQLVHGVDEARALVNSKRTQFLASGGAGVLPPPNLAIEFVDIADEQGRYHKCRAYVVGNNVVLRHKTVSTHWLVNFASSESFGDSADANRDFIRGGESDLELLARAGRASGSDVTALDYSRTQDGEYVFWEANRLFKMNGDKDYDLLESTAESKVKRRAAIDRKLGKSLLALLQERLSIH